MFCLAHKDRVKIVHCSTRSVTQLEGWRNVEKGMAFTASVCGDTTQRLPSRSFARKTDIATTATPQDK